MTIERTNVYSGPFAANGVTVTFPFDFHAASEQEVTVQLGGITVDPAQYSVALNPDGTGSITFFVAPTGALYIFSAPLFTQEVDFEDQGPFYQSSVNEPIDRSALRDLYLLDRVLRSFIIPRDVNVDGMFPVVLPGGTPGFSLGGGADANLRPDLASSLGASFIGFLQNGTGAILRTLLDKARERVSVTDFMSSAQRAAVLAGTSTDDTAAFTAALATSAKEVFVPVGTYRVGGLSIPTGKVLRGAGQDKTILKIVSGFTATIVNSIGTTGAEIHNLTIDGTGTDFDNNVGLYLSGATSFRFSDLTFIATGGSAVWVISSPRTRGQRVSITGITDPNSWAFHVQGSNSVQSIFSDILIYNCNTRGVMVRDTSNVSMSNVTCSGNRGTAMWFQNALWCVATNIIDRNDLIGDSFVIEGASQGTWIIGATSKQCGGHGASIAGNVLYGVPQDCHIVDVYCEDQGECLACISAQDSLGQVYNCSIRNAHGKNSGMGNSGPGGTAVPSEGFAIVSATGCTITGRITDTAGNMPAAAVEQGGNGGASNNAFEIDGWVAGSAGTQPYGRLVSSTSVIKHRLLDERTERNGDADFTWNAGSSNRTVLYDLANLTAIRAVTLVDGWANLEVMISRPSGGAFGLQIKQGATVLKTLNAATWAQLKHDGTNWNVIAGGTI